jgi:hypothetical protein
VPLTPFYPRGNPLTESMPFPDRDGVRWLAYIEGVPSATRWQRSHAGLPGRRLRFDSPIESRATAHLPAGSPEDASLLDHPVIEWATRAGERGRELVADWSRRWRRRADRAQGLHHRRFLG